METCLTLENINDLLSGNLSDNEQEEFYAHMAICDDCRREVVEAEELLEAGNDMEWAQLSMAEARQVMSTFNQTVIGYFSLLRKFIEKWISLDDLADYGAAWNNIPELVPVVSKPNYRRFGNSKSKCMILPFEMNDISLDVVIKKENDDSFALYIINVLSRTKKASLQIYLWKDNRFIASRLYTSIRTLFNDNRSCEQYHLKVNQNVNDILHIKTVSRDDLVDDSFYLIDPALIVDPTQNFQDIFINSLFKNHISGGKYQLVIKDNSKDICQFNITITDEGK